MLRNVKTSVPIPKFASFCGGTFTNFGIERTLANHLIQRGFGSKVRMKELAARIMPAFEPPH
jgi:hypothetical protein